MLLTATTRFLPDAPEAVTQILAKLFSQHPEVIDLALPIAPDLITFVHEADSQVTRAHALRVLSQFASIEPASFAHLFRQFLQFAQVPVLDVEVSRFVQHVAVYLTEADLRFYFPFLFVSLCSGNETVSKNWKASFLAAISLQHPGFLAECDVLHPQFLSLLSSIESRPIKYGYQLLAASFPYFAKQRQRKTGQEALKMAVIQLSSGSTVLVKPISLFISRYCECLQDPIEMDLFRLLVRSSDVSRFRDRCYAVSCLCDLVLRTAMRVEFDEPDEFLEFVHQVLMFSILRGQMDLIMKTFMAIKVLIQQILVARDFHSIAAQARDVIEGCVEELESMDGPPTETAEPDDPMAVTIDQILRLLNN
jgi:hypothetical protein